MTLKERREELNMTQIDVAIKCEVSLSSYRNWEAGVTKPNEENYRKLIKILRMEE